MCTVLVGLRVYILPLKLHSKTFLCRTFFDIRPHEALEENTFNATIFHSGNYFFECIMISGFAFPSFKAMVGLCVMPKRLCICTIEIVATISMICTYKVFQ